MRQNRTARNLPPRAGRKLKLDSTLLSIIALLTAWGLIMVYSGSVLVAAKLELNPYYFFVRQFMWVMVGTVAGFIAYKVDYHHLPKLALPALVISFVFLIAVLLINWGDPIRRWIRMGPIDFQPSELTKLAFMIYLSSWLTKKHKITASLKVLIRSHLVYEFLSFTLLLAIICIPILLQPDLDTTIILAGTSFLVYFIAGNDYIHLLGSTLMASIFGAAGFILTKIAPYRLIRVTNWYSFISTGEIADRTGAGYQLQQLLVAVASGGIFGLGFGNSRQKFHYLGDTAFTDTIFAIFAEEFGLIGSAILILIFIYILLRGYKIAMNAPDKLGFLLAISITTWIILQSFLHLASNVALIPINGNTLPFFSYGGSSTVINFAAIGILLNVSKHSNFEK